MKPSIRCFILAAFLQAAEAFSATFTVTNTNVTGAGSLQQAIADANTNAGPDLITFSIPGDGPHIISPTVAQPLASITNAVTIDGYTQTNATPNTLSNGFNGVIKIQIDGISAGSFAHGITLATSNCVLRGLSITRFGTTGSDGINLLTGAHNNVIEGNLIGLRPTGLGDYGNIRNGITVTSASGNLIGGTNLAARNVISGNNQYGVMLQGAGCSNNVIQGNTVGLSLSGAENGNGSGGIRLLGVSRNTIGGNEPGARNVVSANNIVGIIIESGGATNRVLGNFISLSSYGVFISGNANTISNNIVTSTFSGGVHVSSGTNNAIRGNSIFGNGFGINLGADGVTANDSGDPDTGANNLQNFPLLTNAFVTRSNVVIHGTLNSQSNSIFHLDFYANPACHPSGNGEGQFWLTNAQVTTDTDGNAIFAAILPPSARDMFITSTATDTNGNTSEFSACFQAVTTIPPLTFIVINTNDSGPGSLRQALIDVDQEVNFGRDTVAFNIPGGGVKTIFPLSALPTPLDPVLIDGYTQTGTVSNSLASGNNAVLKLRLDGSLAGGPGVDGLHLTSRSNIVRGLCIIRFAGDGIEFQGSGGNQVRDVWLGFDIPPDAPPGLVASSFVSRFNRQNGQTANFGDSSCGDAGLGKRGLYFNNSDSDDCNAVLVSCSEEAGVRIDFAGFANTGFLNCSSTHNDGAAYLCNADGVNFTTCYAGNSPIGFDFNGDNNFCDDCMVEQCADGWTVAGNNNGFLDCTAIDIADDAFDIESGTGNVVDLASVCDVGDKPISEADPTTFSATDVSVGVSGSQARFIFTIPGTVSGSHTIAVMVKDNTPPIEGCPNGYRRVGMFNVTKTSTQLTVNQAMTTSFPIMPGDEVIIIVTSINGTAEAGAATVAFADSRPDVQTIVMPFSPSPLRLGDTGRGDVQVINNGLGAATDVWVNISAINARILDVVPPPGGSVSGPVNGVFTVSIGPVAKNEAKITSVTFVPPPSGTFSVSGTATPNGQTDGDTSNNTGSRSGSAASATGSPLIVTHADTTSAGDDGDPISLLTGELFNSFQADLSIGGPMPLGFSRYYASFLKRLGRIGPLGDNWRHNFEWTLTNRTTTVDVISDMGRRIIFTNSAGSYTLIGRRDIPFQLQTNGGNFILGDPRSQRLYTFDGSGKLTQIQDGHGNTHALAYTGTNLTSVTDGLGRTLSFQYSPDGFLTNVSDGVRSVALTQTSNNLTSVGNPLGLVTTYNYNLAHATNGLMTNSVMPKGNVPYAQTFDASGRVATQTEAGTNTHTLAYAINLTTMTNPLGRTRRYVHTSTGELLTFTDENSLTLGMGYNTNGQRAAIADRLSNLTRLGFHAPSGYVSSITNADGTFTTFAYTNRVFGGATFFDLAKTTYPDGATETFTYDTSGNVLTRTDRGGNVFTFTYNARGQVLTAQNPLGGVITFTYHANGTLASRTDTDTGTTTFAYDSFSRLTNVVHPDGTMLKSVYDANDRVTSVTDERNNTYTFTYDDNGNVASVTDPLSQTAQFAYDTRDRLLHATDRLGKTSSVGYDKLDQITSRTNRNGNLTQFTYDTRRRLSSVTDPGNQVWSFGYDNEALLTAASNPLSQTNRIRRDQLGYEVGFTNALNQSAGLVRDTLRRVTATVDALLRTNGFGYDSRGLLTNSAKPVVGSAAYTRNPLGLLSRITDLNGSPWNFGYTPMGRAQFVADPLNRTNRFNYDNRGRSSVTTFADGTTRSNSYDQASNPTRRQYSDSTDLQYSYDALNRIVAANDVALAYDAEGRVTNTASSGVNFGAAHDAGGRLTNITYNAGAFAVTYTYDSRDRLVSVSDSLTGTTLAFTYDNAGRLTGVTRPNGVNGTHTYDAAGRLVRIQEGALIDLQYALDAAGQVTNLIYTLPLDPTNGLSNSTSNWTHDAAHQINNAGYKYDARGRLTNAPGQSFQYDAASRLKQINAAQLAYNGFNDVITRAEGGTTNRYFYNRALGMNPIVTEKNETTGQILRYYIWSPGGRLLYLIDSANGNAVRHFHFDSVGSTLALTDAAGAVTDSYAYTPYGELLARTGTSAQPFLYVGRFGVRSEPGAKLYHMRARYYDPLSGRFLTRDPIWPVLSEPGSLDPYQYAADNPLKFIDPHGLSPFEYLAYVAESVVSYIDPLGLTPVGDLLEDHISEMNKAETDLRWEGIRLEMASKEARAQAELRAEREAEREAEQAEQAELLARYLERRREEEKREKERLAKANTATQSGVRNEFIIPVYVATSRSWKVQVFTLPEGIAEAIGRGNNHLPGSYIPVAYNPNNPALPRIVLPP